MINHWAFWAVILVASSGWGAFAYVRVRLYQERKREVSRLFKVTDVHTEITKVGLTPSAMTIKGKSVILD